MDKNQVLNFSAIILSILLQAGSGICGKYAAITTQDPSLFMTVFNVFYLLSVIFLVMQAVIWQQALMHYPLSFAYPFVSLVNFVILIFSSLLFNEQITLNNISGLILISLGILVLSRDPEGET
ncbi:MAG: hypothetical protein ACPK85_11065 [Methanosarcina sp.]